MGVDQHNETDIPDDHGDRSVAFADQPCHKQESTGVSLHRFFPQATSVPIQSSHFEFMQKLPNVDSLSILDPVQQLAKNNDDFFMCVLVAVVFSLPVAYACL